MMGEHKVSGIYGSEAFLVVATPQLSDKEARDVESIVNHEIPTLKLIQMPAATVLQHVFTESYSPGVAEDCMLDVGLAIRRLGHTVTFEDPLELRS